MNKAEALAYFNGIEVIYKDLKHGRKKPNMPDILNNFCKIINGNEVFIDFKFFKLVGTPETYSTLIQYITNTIQKILETNPSVSILHINLKSMSILDIDKHYVFIKGLSLATDFTDYISACSIYQSGFIFGKLLTAIFSCLDKPTQLKIKQRITLVD
jgi:hypothetical protein